MSDTESRLLSILSERSLKRGIFKLASGDTTDHYIDGKMSEVFSEAALLIGQVLYERTKDLDFDAIGGLEAGAIPLTTAAVIAYQLNGRTMEGFWVRTEAKTHGTKKAIEGNLEPGSRVVIVDDVITRGTSAGKAIRAVHDLDCKVVRVISLVDRLVGAREYFRGLGIECYESIFDLTDFGVGNDVHDANHVAVG